MGRDLISVMNDEDERENERKARWRKFQEAIPGGALAAAGARIGGPAGAAGAALVLPWAIDFFGNVLREWGRDSGRRTGSMAASAGDALNCGPEELADLMQQSERTRGLAITATIGAARTTWSPKVQALGRALADGLIAEGDTEADLTDMALAAMAELERPHVALLELLVHSDPPPVPGRWEGEGESRSRRWTAQAIVAAQPGMSPVFRGLLETLVHYALVYEVNQTAEAFSQFSRSTVAYLNRVAGRAMRRQPALDMDGPGVPSVSPAWSPTPFGERVLGYYRDAGADPEAVPPSEG